MNLQSVQPALALPARYYLNHFNEFVGAIEERYQHVLEPEHRSFIIDFKALNDDAQCLYVRMLNRRGLVFDCRRFNYQEIQNLGEQVNTLKHAGFIRELHRYDLKELFEIITKEKLLVLIAQQCSMGSYRRSWSKSELIEFALGHLSFSHPTVIEEMQHCVVQSRVDQIGYLLFLYFGKFETGLSQFTLRDLGVVRTSKFKNKFKPRFDNKQSALSTWFYCQKLDQVRRLNAHELEKFSQCLKGWPTPAGEQSTLLRERVLYTLGEMLERSGNQELAIQIYQQSASWPASERLIRLQYANGARTEVARSLEKIIDDPACEEEYLFAQDFYQRKFHKKRTSRITDVLRSGSVIKLDECHRVAPEEGAAHYFRAQGAEVFHCENRIWKKLFGLLFWDILFNNESSALYNDFEKRPRDLEIGMFYERFKVEIERRLDTLNAVDAVQRDLLTTVMRHYGIANSIFRWRANMLDEVRALLPLVPASALQKMLRRMAQDYAGNHSGFPDLLVIHSGSARFVEIKAEGDQLRRNQLKQILAMQNAGLTVEVNRIEWMVDPQQIYVVVDIETTGRRSNANRITEVAAVKMQNGEIIGRWESLINPCRSIPHGIVELTGINDTMVADAPVFSEIADDFRAFTAGAVFVAHNVRFDYSFIGDEYRRLQQSFNMPTLCSCTQMRKWYPGLKSYSLKSLCERFNISLDSHHRAMCDAEAAAELLKMINLRRTTQH